VTLTDPRIWFLTTDPDSTGENDDPRFRTSDEKRRLRILFFNNEYWPSGGGVEVLTRNLARALRDRGHTVAIATAYSSPDQPPASEVDGLDVHRFAFNRALRTRDWAEMASLTAKVDALKREFQPDIVHVNFPASAAFFHLQSIRPGQTTVAAFHSLVWPKISPLARSLAERADALIVPSRFLAGDIASTLSRTPEEFRILENGVAEAPLLSIRPLPDQPPARFLFAGRLEPSKGPEIAVDALADLSRRGVAAELWIAGEGSLDSALSRPRDGWHPEGRITLLGKLPQEELAGRFGDVAALLVPSLAKEAFSLVTAEAAFAGRPVLASRIGALPETVIDGETGLLFDPGNPASLADLMQRVLFEPGLAVHLGAAARERAQSRFRLSLMVDRYENLYRDEATARIGKQSTEGPTGLKISSTSRT
jgi:glycogen(starch) synthase